MGRLKGSKLTEETKRKIRDSLRKGIIKKCLICQREFYAQNCKIKINEGKFCSKQCSDINKKGKKFSLQHRNNISLARKKLFEIDPDMQTGSNHPQWKGGRIKSWGYILIKKREHPFCDHQGYVSEHRLVVEKCLKRYLMYPEECHHLNGNHSDNRPQNLMAFINHSAHRRFEEGKQKVKSKEIIFDGRQI